MKSLDEISREPHDFLISRVWFHMLRAHRNLYPKMEKRLRAHGFDSPLWHEILTELERAQEEGIRSSELQKKLFMAQHNLSRHLSRMEKKGFIERTACPKDKRAHFLHISEKGREANRAIWPYYFEAVQLELSDKFDRDEAFQMFQYLIRLYS
ncbi:MAG: MarR family transcriptional regulator [Cohaesibacter sp.]|nr:MarR family transcriptional regulator [Cohaesibacter sp.]